LQNAPPRAPVYRILRRTRLWQAGMFSPSENIVATSPYTSDPLYGFCKETLETLCEYGVLNGVTIINPIYRRISSESFSED
jgi:hypothetical protein